MGLGRGYFLYGDRMRREPRVKRAVAFIDGQNLFHAARHAFGYQHPNFDPVALARAVCARMRWSLRETRLYTGVPDPDLDSFWHAYWTAKLSVMRKLGVTCIARPLRYRRKLVKPASGQQRSVLVAEEKGIDVRIAIDILRLGFHRQYDVALLFSQDQDLAEAAVEIQSLAQQQRRWIKIASAFPGSARARNTRGIDRTDWISVSKQTYDECLDYRDYRAMR